MKTTSNGHGLLVLLRGTTGCVFQYVEKLVVNWYLGDGDLGDAELNAMLKVGTRVTVHDDGQTYCGATTQIIVDTRNHVWMQCKFDSADDARVSSYYFQ